jgi:hypothetical protein
MIPKKLYQTHKSSKLPITLQELTKRMVQLNPELDYTFMDNDQCLEFITQNFDKDFIQMYKSLPLDIMRADVWRVAIIYINGGIYCDTDVYAIEPLHTLIQGKELVLFTEEKGGTSNFFFAAKPKHPALKAVLDLFVKHQDITRDTHSDFLVQNFGMDLFHKVMSQVKDKTILTYEESRKWVHHHWYNTWKQTEEKYKDASNSTKPITFFTTFNDNGYKLYGKDWIESFIHNVASKRNNINAIVYAHNVKGLDIEHPQLTILDFDKEIKGHTQFKTQYLAKSTHPDYTKKMAVRFSHKGFVIKHVLKNIKNDGYLIWLDGDGIFKGGDYQYFPGNVLQDSETLACQIEDDNHVESGILIFDSTHKDIDKFTKAYEKNYDINEILHKYGEPYDGHVMRRSVNHSQVKFIDLNKQHGRGGIQSDPNETFLHPEIKARFIHNIGPTGKKQYSNWRKVSEIDDIFKLLDNKSLRHLSPQQKKIVKLRNKR